MNKKLSKKVKKILSFVFWLFLPTLPLLIPNLEKNSILLTLLSSGYIAWCLKLSIDTFDQANFLYNKAILRLFNREVSWTMNINLFGNFEPDILQIAFSAIKKLIPEVETWRNDELGIVFKLPSSLGGTIRLDLSEDNFHQDLENKGSLFIELSNFVVPYNNSCQSLLRLFDLLNDAILPLVDTYEEKYTFKINFGGTNPYFGLFIRRLRIPEESSIYFNVEFEEKEGANNGKVSISQDRVVIITHNLSSLQSLTKKYITLSSLNLSDS